MEQEQSPEVAPHRAGTSRRVIVKSAAWSVPVFATVGVTPAFAATGGGTVVPIIASTSLSGSRGSGGTKEQVTFSWNIQVNVAISSVVVQYPTVTNHTLVNETTTFTGTTGAHQLSFRLDRKTGNDDAVPSFTITINFTYNGAKSAIFNVVGATVAENGTVAFTVNAPTPPNPTVTI